MKLYKGDNLTILKNMDDNTFDTCITDPPYGLKFMSTKWDYDVPSVELWKEVYRVLKPGAFLLSFGGTRTWHRIAVNIEDAGFEIRDTLMWLYGQGFPKSFNVGKGVKARGIEPDTWEDYGTGLKPAFEPIVMARKPYPFVDGALEYGVAGLNIEGSRIPTEEVIPVNKLKSWSGFGQEVRPDYKKELNTDGRFPANVLLDEEAGEILDEQGDYSRFFYCAKVSKKEREEGLENLNDKKPAVVTDHRPTVETNPEKWNNLDNHPRMRTTERKNNHPTIKPIELMTYLCTLTKTPTGGIVLDPYLGSGSTLIGCIYSGREGVGIELDDNYFGIAVARLRYHKEKYENS